MVMEITIRALTKAIQKDEGKGSCRFCLQGNGKYIAKAKNGEVFFLCEKHKNYKPKGDLP